MQSRIQLVGFVLVVGANSMWAAGCGGSSTDSGTTASDGGVKGSAASDSGSDSSLLSTLFPDATPICVDAASIPLADLPACLETACGAAFTNCFNDCSCQAEFQTAGIQGISKLGSSSNANTAALANCLGANLLCGLAGSDAGAKDASAD